MPCAYLGPRSAVLCSTPDSTRKDSRGSGRMSRESRTEIKDYLLLVDHSNVRIVNTPDGEGGLITTFTTPNGEAPNGNMRVATAVYDPMLNDRDVRITGVQLRYDLANPGQFEAFKRFYARLYNLRVWPREEVDYEYF